MNIAKMMLEEPVEEAVEEVAVETGQHAMKDITASLHHIKLNQFIIVSCIVLFIIRFMTLSFLRT